MKHQIKFFLTTQLRQKRRTKGKNAGFTLIELLVAMILAALVIAPLLGLMVNIMQTDRQEQAKATSEQEMQTALDYIAQDLQQAIYVYDAKGINAIRANLYGANDNNRVPVLVFWKRVIQKNSIPAPAAPGFENAPGKSRPANDAFVYSLVAYYLVRNNPTATNNTWSNTSRIERWEIKDGVRDADSVANGSSNLVTQPDPGFQLFDINEPGSLEQKMNAWRGNTAGNNYTNTPDVLIDYIDNTAITVDPSLAPVDCAAAVFPTRVNNAPPEQQAETRDALRTPAFNGQFQSGANAALNTGSFYACVDSATNSVKVFLRGNAFARIQNNNNQYDGTRAAYFPRASIQVQGRGFIGVE